MYKISFSESIFIISIVCILGLSFNTSFGDPYEWDQTQLSFSWSSLPRAIVLDTNSDGIGDTVYQYSVFTATTGNVITYTKQWGTGANSFTCTVTSAVGSPRQSAIYFDNNGYFYQSIGTWNGAATIGARAGIVNFQSGTCALQPESTAAVGTQNGASVMIFHLTNKTRISAIIGGTVANVGKVWNNGTVIATGTEGFVSPQGVYVSSGTNAPFFVRYDGDRTVPSSIPSSFNSGSSGDTEQYHGTGCTSVCFMEQSGNTVGGTFLGRGWLPLDPKIDFVLFGMDKIWNGTNTINTGSSTWAPFLTNNINNDPLLTLPISVYDSSFIESPRFYLKNGATMYIGLLNPGATLKYSPLPTLSGKNWQSFILTNSTNSQLDKQMTNAIPSDIMLVRSSISSVSVNQKGSFTLPSGYDVSVNLLNRQTDPQWLNNTSSPKPIIITPITSQSTLSINVKNAPNSAAVDFRSPFFINGVSGTWSVLELDGTGGATVDMVANTCVDVYIRDTSTFVGIWSSLGSVCNNGVMPKQLVYSQNLSFTFWTLPWGTSSTYDQDTDSVQTLVRSSAANYTYNVRIYDRNGTLSQQYQYTNQNGLTTHSYNISSVQTPATIKILDSTNATLYHATMGNGNWLTDFQAFSNQHLTIDGFNLVAMMPLIFAAMWTRNTVSMGTMMTVVMIATLGFFGILAIPEIVLYLMLFIAAIAMVAYKLMY